MVGTLPKIKGGLRALYRTLELPGPNPLEDTPAALDAAYGLNAKKDLLAQLLALNQQVPPRQFRPTDYLAADPDKAAPVRSNLMSGCPWNTFKYSTFSHP